jgi:hypothetical protein
MIENGCFRTSNQVESSITKIIDFLSRFFQEFRLFIEYNFLKVLLEQFLKFSILYKLKFELKFEFK